MEPAEGHACYEVEGLHCGACSTRLYQALAELEVVEKAGVDHITGRAQVLLPVGADDAPVLAACDAEEFPAQRLASNSNGEAGPAGS